MKHHASPVVSSVIGSHGRCYYCGRVVFLAEPSRSLHDGRVVARGGWRHVSDPSSTMVPDGLRQAVVAP